MKEILMCFVQSYFLRINTLQSQLKLLNYFLDVARQNRVNLRDVFV